jgi:hypothetical protein
MPANPFLTTTTTSTPQDGNTPGTPDSKKVSDFITVQSFTNLSAMTGAIVATWKALQLTNWGWTDERWVPLVLCLLFGLVSVLISKLDNLGQWASALFVAGLNSLVLFGAVIGAMEAVNIKTS